MSSVRARKRLSIVVGIGALCAGLGFVQSADGQPRAPRRSQEPSTMVSYREALLSWLPAEADQRLQVIDVAGTSSAAPSTVAYMAADHSVRRFTPMALEAIGKQLDATRLRRLAPITSYESATRALGQIRMTLRSVEEAMAAHPGPRDGAALGAVRASLQNIQLALEVSRGGARARDNAHRAIQGTSLVAHYASDAGVRQPAIIDACARSMTDMVAALRPMSRAAARPSDVREGSAVRRER